MLATLEVKEARSRNHRGIIGRQSRTWRKHRCAKFSCRFGHRRGEGTIARDTSAEHDALATMLPCCARRLLDQRSHERVVEGTRDVWIVIRRGTANGLQNSRL